MKIAIPTKNNQIENHFGRCEEYTVFTVEKEQVIANTESFSPKQGCGCMNDIAHILKQHGVKVMLAGNMGEGALQKLNDQGIRVFRGCSGEARQIAESYLAGEIEDSGQGCSTHRQHHRNRGGYHDHSGSSQRHGCRQGR